jgi:hypothetical protein
MYHQVSVSVNTQMTVLSTTVETCPFLKLHGWNLMGQSTLSSLDFPWLWITLPWRKRPTRKRMRCHLWGLNSALTICLFPKSVPLRTLPAGLDDTRWPLEWLRSVRLGSHLAFWFPLALACNSFPSLGSYKCLSDLHFICSPLLSLRGRGHIQKSFACLQAPPLVFF